MFKYAFQAVCRGFEPHLDESLVAQQGEQRYSKSVLIYVSVAQQVERKTVNLDAVGSNPTRDARCVS